MIRKITETVKGPIISWENYLTDSELLGLKLNLRTFEGIINTLLKQDRLDPGNKTFDDLVEELSVWWNNHSDDVSIKESKSSLPKVKKYYYDLYNHIKNNIDKLGNDFSELNNEYWDEDESVGLYKDLKKLLQSNIRLRDMDYNLKVIDKDKYDLDNKIDSIMLDYVNKRLKSLTESKEVLLEKGRNDILNKTRRESPGRWKRRQNYKDFRFIKADIKDLDDKDRVVVTFEVGDYTVIISFNNILLNLREVVKQDPKHMVKFDWVLRACNRAIDQSDIYVNCQCKDFKYRYAYVASKNSYKYGKKELRSADIRNPNDNIGGACKHILSVLSNKNWMTRVATTVNDWLQMKDVYEIRDLLNYDEANMPSDISRDLGKQSARAKGVERNFQYINSVNKS